MYSTSKFTEILNLAERALIKFNIKNRVWVIKKRPYKSRTRDGHLSCNFVTKTKGKQK